MFRKFLDLVTSAITIGNEVARNQRQIEAVATEARRLNERLDGLESRMDLLEEKIRGFSQHEQDEREKLQLALQAMEHRLPPAPPDRPSVLG